MEKVDDELKTLVADMFETMYDAPGIGLAAVQVGVPIRLLVIDLQEPEDPRIGEPVVRQPRVFINPEILWHSDDEVPYTEGCLSVPEQYAEVKRPDSIRARWLDENGKAHEEEIDGMLAVCLQHEMDHLERRAVHRPSLAAEARHGAKEARQVADKKRVVLPERGDRPPRRSRLRSQCFARSADATRQSAAHSRHICAHSLQCSWSCFSHSAAHSSQTRAHSSSISRSTCSFEPVRRTASLPAASHTSEQSRQMRMHCAHVHFLGRAGVGAAEAHPRAIHQMVRGIAERLVDVPGDVRVKGDHLADGHRFSLAGQTCG